MNTLYHHRHIHSRIVEKNIKILNRKRLALYLQILWKRCSLPNKDIKAKTKFLIWKSTLVLCELRLQFCKWIMYIISHHCERKFLFADSDIIFIISLRAKTCLKYISVVCKCLLFEVLHCSKSSIYHEFVFTDNGIMNIISLRVKNFPRSQWYNKHYFTVNEIFVFTV